jgi:hypothetical protein
VLAGEEGDALEASGVFGGPGADGGVVFEEVVDEAALVGVHGVELDGLTGGGNLGGDLPDAIEEALDFVVTEVFDIDPDAGSFGEFLAEEFVHEVLEIVQPLADAGVDFFHCSTRRFWEPAFDDSPLGLAAWVRRLSGKATIAVGSVTLENDFKSATGKTAAPAAPEQIELLERGLGEGHFDLIAIGRALLANPDWAQLVEAGHSEALRGFARADLDSLR